LHNPIFFGVFSPGFEAGIGSYVSETDPIHSILAPKIRFTKIHLAGPKAQLAWAAVVGLLIRGEDFATFHAARPGLPFGQGRGPRVAVYVNQG
jgi:hypothetical protein